MQISRHWRIKQQRYRLEGVRFQNGVVSLQNRSTPQMERDSAAQGNREAQRTAVTLGR
ncbi:MAG: hypothetical protein U0670_20030 [Anaerolineae bacterium]